MAEDRLTGPLLFAVGAGATAAGLLLDRRRRRRSWAANPDPLEGRTPTFPTGWTRFVETDDGARIRTVTAGEGPRVVMVHGLTSSIDDLGPIAEHLVAAGYSVTGVDQRGHGGSSVGHEGFGAERQGRDLAAVLAELDLRDALLAGHSMGGIASLQMALDDPDAVKRHLAGLVAIAAPTRLRAKWRRAITELVRIPQPDFLARDRGRLLPAAAYVFGRRPSLFMLEQALDSYFRCPADTRRDATLGLQTYRVDRRLPDLEIPTLVVIGQADRLIPRGNAMATARKAPNARAVELLDAGHMLIWERHSELASELISFLDGLGPTRVDAAPIVRST